MWDPRGCNSVEVILLLTAHVYIEVGDVQNYCDPSSNSLDEANMEGPEGKESEVSKIKRE